MTWKLREEITQREAEAFETLYNKFGIDDMRGMATICLLYTSPSPRD